MDYQIMEAKIGPLTLVGDEDALAGLYFGEAAPANAKNESNKVLERTKRQLEEYFEGKRKVFDLPLNPQGTPFQEKVWQALLDIPYGETKAYSDIAAQVGSPKACRAVGGANHNNPISIIIPCHRVIGKNRKLVGYGGGLDIKEYLLGLENPSKPHSGSQT